MIPERPTREEAKAAVLALEVVWMHGNAKIGYGVTSDKMQVVQLCANRTNALQEAAIIQEDCRKAGHPIPIVMEKVEPIK